jgi:hypothetical protein
MDVVPWTTVDISAIARFDAAVYPFERSRSGLLIGYLSFAKTGSALISVAVCVSEAGDLTNTIVKAVRCAEYRGLHADGA